MIVRAAEAALEQITRAREAIGGVVFGQTQVVENTLITILSGGHGLLVGVPGLAKTQAGRHPGDGAGPAEPPRSSSRPT